MKLISAALLLHPECKEDHETIQTWKTAIEELLGTIGQEVDAREGSAYLRKLFEFTTCKSSKPERFVEDLGLFWHEYQMKENTMIFRDVSIQNIFYFHKFVRKKIFDRPQDFHVKQCDMFEESCRYCEWECWECATNLILDFYDLMEEHFKFAEVEDCSPLTPHEVAKIESAAELRDLRDRIIGWWAASEKVKKESDMVVESTQQRINSIMGKTKQPTFWGFFNKIATCEPVNVILAELMTVIKIYLETGDHKSAFNFDPLLISVGPFHRFMKGVINCPTYFKRSTCETCEAFGSCGYDSVDCWHCSTNLVILIYQLVEVHFPLMNPKKHFDNLESSAELLELRNKIRDNLPVHTARVEVTTKQADFFQKTLDQAQDYAHQTLIKSTEEYLAEKRKAPSFQSFFDELPIRTVEESINNLSIAMHLHTNSADTTTTASTPLKLFENFTRDVLKDPYQFKRTKCDGFCRVKEGECWFCGSSLVLKFYGMIMHYNADMDMTSYDNMRDLRQSTYNALQETINASARENRGSELQERPLTEDEAQRFQTLFVKGNS